MLVTFYSFFRTKKPVANGVFDGTSNGTRVFLGFSIGLEVSVVSVLILVSVSARLFTTRFRENETTFLPLFFDQACSYESHIIDNVSCKPISSQVILLQLVVT